MNDVDCARKNYVRLGGQLKAHRNQCPHMTMPCHAWLSRLTDAASIALDNAIAESISGPRPARVVPVWLGVEAA